MRKSDRGFSLIEVIVCVAILAILAAITYPVVRRSQVSGVISASLQRQRQVYMAINLYGIDNPGFESLYPGFDLPVEALRRPNLVLGYLKDREMLHCPAAPPCAKIRISHTFTFTAPPDAAHPMYKLAMGQLTAKLEAKPDYPVIRSLIIDEVYFHPSEKDLSEFYNFPYVAWIRVDGSAKQGRYDVLREFHVAKNCSRPSVLP